MSVQPDLFGYYDAEQAERAAHLKERAWWRAHFRPAKVTIAYESSSDKPGDIIDAVTCPACGGVEFNSFLLSINHGWDPDVPRRNLYGLAPFRTCMKLRLLAGGRSDVSVDGISVVRLPAP